MNNASDNIALGTDGNIRFEPEEQVAAVAAVTAVKCQCGSDYCHTYGLSEGTFYQGTGFDKEVAEEYAAAINQYRSQQAATPPNPVQAFADKHDICEFGREMFRRKQPKTLAETWEIGDMLVDAFMYVKGVENADPVVFQRFAIMVRHDLHKNGFTQQANLLSEIIDKFLRSTTEYFALQRSMNALVPGGARKLSTEANTGKLQVTVARNIALFALDYASQARYGKFDLKFSYRMAEKFREMVGDNPFTGR